MRLKRFYNRPEEMANSQLEGVLRGLDYHVKSKCRLADVFEINNSGLSDEDFSFALKAHFDFLILDNQLNPKFAVEFDGPQHSTSKQAQRDLKKDKLCELAGLPILRIDSGFLDTEVRQMSLLTWICKIWAYEQDFNSAQQDGYIPPDEPFLYFSVMTEEVGGPITFPYDISLPARQYMHNLHAAGRTKSWGARVAIYSDQGRCYAESFFRLMDDWVAVGKASVKEFHFRPISPQEVAQELATIDLVENIKEIYSQKKRATPLQYALTRISQIEAKAVSSLGFKYTVGEVWS